MSESEKGTRRTDNSQGSRKCSPLEVTRMTKQREKQRSQDWRKEMEGVTPEQLAKALLRPIGQTKAKGSAP